MIPDIPYSKLKTFYYVAINKSFKKAALDLYITEGAVSQQVKDLEQRLEKKLLERSSKETVLTHDGMSLFNIVAPVVERLENIVNEFKQKSGRLTGKVTVASFEAFLRHFFPDYLNKFKSKYPDCEIFLFNATGKHIESMVLSGKVDFGIGSTEDLPEGVFGKEQWDFKRYFIAPLGHPLSKKKHLTFQDIAQFPIVMPDRTSKTGHRMFKELERYNPNLKITVEAGEWDLVMQYVKMGFGVSMLPGIAIQSKDRKQLYLIALSEIDETVSISRYGILVRKGKYLSPIARELIRFLSPDFDFSNHP